MTRDQARRYLRRWDEAGRLLDEQRWHELPTLSPERALAAASALIDAALRVPLPAARRASSGLVDQQRVFHRKRP
ncbi:MAG: hypothetical protein ABI665_21825 [Vicinamibacterales bacterium]